MAFIPCIHSIKIGYGGSLPPFSDHIPAELICQYYYGSSQMHSLLKPHPYGGIMSTGSAIETLRDEAPLHAASTPPVEAVLAAGYGHDVGEFNGA